MYQGSGGRALKNKVHARQSLTDLSNLPNGFKPSFISASKQFVYVNNKSEIILYQAVTLTQLYKVSNAKLRVDNKPDLEVMIHLPVEISGKEHLLVATHSNMIHIMVPLISTSSSGFSLEIVCRTKIPTPEYCFRWFDFKYNSAKKQILVAGEFSTLETIDILIA